MTVGHLRAKKKPVSYSKKYNRFTVGDEAINSCNRIK